MPDLMDVEDLVSLFHGFLQLRCTPRTCELSLLIGVIANRTTLQHGFFHLGLDTGGTERKGQLAMLAKRKDRMVEFLRW